MWKTIKNKRPEATIACFDPDTCEHFKRSIPHVGIDMNGEAASFCVCQFDTWAIEVEATFCIGRVENGKELVTLSQCEDFNPVLWTEHPQPDDPALVTNFPTDVGVNHRD